MNDDPDLLEAQLKQYPLVELRDICRRIETRLNALENEVDALTERIAKLENRFITRWPA
jgi:polyhydroxyalkanoate synthesis regulator phasin